MSVSPSVGRSVERIVHRPDSAIAARVMGRAGGDMELTINDVVFDLAGGAEYVELWYRLTVTRGRCVDWLSMAQVAAAGHYLAGQQFGAVGSPED